MNWNRGWCPTRSPARKQLHWSDSGRQGPKLRSGKEVVKKHWRKRNFKIWGPDQGGESTALWRNRFMLRQRKQMVTQREPQKDNSLLVYPPHPESPSFLFFFFFNFFFCFYYICRSIFKTENMFGPQLRVVLSPRVWIFHGYHHLQTMQLCSRILRSVTTKQSIHSCSPSAHSVLIG